MASHSVCLRGEIPVLAKRLWAGWQRGGYTGSPQAPVQLQGACGSSLPPSFSVHAALSSGSQPGRQWCECCVLGLHSSPPGDTSVVGEVTRFSPDMDFRVI